MKKLRLVSMIAMAAVLFATAGCVAQKADEVSDALDKGQVVSRVESQLIDLTADRDFREEAEDVVDAETDMVAPDLEEFDFDALEFDPVPCTIIPVEIDISTPIDNDAVEGENYDQLFSATGGSGVFGWNCTVNGSPCDLSGTGLHFETYGTYQAKIKGIPDAADVGVLVYTITAYDLSDPSESDSVDHNLTVTAAEVDDQDSDTDDGEGDCSQPLSISWKTNGTNKPDDDKVPHTLGQHRWVELTVTGGKGPYTWTVNSRVEDSHHRYNAGGGDYAGFLNYEYRDPAKPCLTAEEFLDIYGETIVLGDEEEVEEADSFWPDCSPPTPSDVKFECEELGCGGYWYDMSDKMQEQCTNGFDCSGANWQSLTTTQRKACMEHQSEENMEKVHEAMEDAYGTPKYICKWTEDPTWRKEGVELPLYIDKTGSYAHPSSNWDWNPPEQYGDWTPEESYKTDGKTITFVSDMEFDGPLPVNRQKYMGEKRPVERLTFTVMDSCSVPQKAVASLNALLEYPDSPITDFKVEMLFTNLHFEAEGHEKLDDFYVDFMFMSEAGEVASQDEAGYPSLIKHVGVEAHFGIANWINPVGLFDVGIVDESNVCKGESCSESADIGISEESDLDPSDVPTVKEVTGIYMQIELGSDWHLEQKLGDGVVGWNEYTEYGDMDIKHIYIGSRYWRAHYDDARAGNVFDKNVNKGNIGQRWLSDEDGWEDMNNNGAPFGFHRRALFGGKFIP